jgi:hypothetical protein
MDVNKFAMKARRFISLIAAVILMLVCSMDASAWWPARRTPPPPKPPSTGVVNAPLDGILLSILAAAGVSYFVIRRKKK